MFHRGVLIKREHYYAILAEEVRTIREGVLIEKGALTEKVRYVCTSIKDSPALELRYDSLNLFSDKEVIFFSQ